MTEHVVVERRGPVQVIRMNRPDTANALNLARWHELRRAFTALDETPSVRVVRWLRPAAAAVSPLASISGLVLPCPAALCAR